MIYKIDKRFDCRVARSARVLECAEAFGMGLQDKEFVIYDNLELEVNPGDIVYITGQSGSGKSLLLRELQSQMENTANIDQVEIDETKAIIDQVGKDTNQAINMLTLAGLNDAFLFIRKPQELSDGQLYRFRIAKLLESNASVWVADEFGAVLDRTTAAMVAFNLQKQARSVGATVIVATTHKDLKEELGPNVYVDKEYHESIKVEVNRG